MKKYNEFITERNKFSPNTKLPNNYEIFKNSIINNDLNVLRSIIDTIDVNEKIFNIFDDDKKYNWTPLLYISNLTKIRNNKYRYNSESKNTTNKNDTTFAEELIKYGANINEKDINGNTPLIYSAIYGNLDLCKLLINKDANLNIQNNNGLTASKLALDKAISNGGEYIKIVIELINAKSNIFIKDNNGESFYDSFNYNWSSPVYDNWKFIWKKYIEDNSIYKLIVNMEKYNL